MWSVAARVIGIGWTIAIFIVIGLFAGRWVGQQLGAEGFFALLGVFFGLALATISTYLILRPLLEQRDDDGEK